MSQNWVWGSLTAEINATAAAIFSLLLNSLLVYLILKRSPRSIQKYARILLGCVAVDLCFTTMEYLCQMRMNLKNGYLIYAIGGVCSKLDPEWGRRCICLFSTSVVCNSLVLPVQYYCRYLLGRNRFRWTHAFGCFLLVVVIAISFVMFTFAALAKQEQPWDVENLWYDEQPGSTLYFSEMTFVPFVLLMLYTLFLFVAGYSLIVYFIWKSVQQSRALRDQHSERTRKLQSQFTKALTVQAIVPLCTSGLPIIMSIGFLFAGLDARLFGIITTLSISWVPMLNPLGAIFFISPYRNVLIRAVANVGKCRLSKTVISTLGATGGTSETA